MAQMALLGHADGKSLAESLAELSADYNPGWELELPPGPRGADTAAGMGPAFPPTTVLGTGLLRARGHRAEGQQGLGNF